MTVEKISKGDLTKRRILEIARELFFSNGYERTSTAQIAKEVGVCEAAMYKYFAGKKKLLLAAVQFDERANLPEKPSKLANEELVQLWGAQLLAQFNANHKQYTILFAEVSHHPELAQPYKEATENLLVLNNEIKKRMNVGRLPKLDLNLFQIALIGSIISMVQHLTMLDERNSSDTLPESVHAIILKIIDENLLPS